MLRIFAGAVAVIGLAAATGAEAPQANEARTAKYYDSIRDDPVRLGMFLRAMPKGGDLHVHLSGAVYAESFIAWAAADGDCIDPVTTFVVPPPCAAHKGAVPAADFIKQPGQYRRLVDSYSMKDFKDPAASGHDHFFDAFAKFSVAGGKRGGDMLAEVATRAAAEHIAYLEIMSSPGMGEARGLAQPPVALDDFDHEKAKLMPKLAPIVLGARRELDLVEARMRDLLHCGTGKAEPGCAVTIRYLAQVTRTFPAEQVFAECLLAHELVKADPRVVGLNLVAPEDDPVTLADYTQQMRILGYLGAQDPSVKLSLHAGELTMGLVPVEDLHFHIKQAVEIAGARRIGHGVDLMYEDDPIGLLGEIASRHVLVEINLTSNDVILGVSGKDHPFETYRRSGVPMALSTDDQGISRIDLTHEYVRAAETYGLSYHYLKTLVRNSLDYSFLAGESLWQSTEPFMLKPACAAAGACADLLDHSDRARIEQQTEAAFQAFEATPWPEHE